MKWLIFLFIISLVILTSCSTSSVSKECADKEIAVNKPSNDMELVRNPALYKVYYKNKN
jgi:hypothetical protein